VEVLEVIKLEMLLVRGPHEKVSSNRF